MTPVARRTLMVAATLFALLTPASQALVGWGQSAAEFSDDGAETLRAATYAFSLWGLIYTGLGVQAVFQIFDRRREALYQALSPAIIAVAGCGVWLIASGYDYRWASVVIIVVSAIAAWIALNRARTAPADLIGRLVGVWPIALLGGWLLTASALNILTVFTSEDVIASGSNVAALAGIAAVAALALATLARGVSAVYGLPVAWGLVAVFVAEKPDQPTVAWVALIAAIVVLAASGAAAWRGRKASA